MSLSQQAATRVQQRLVIRGHGGRLDLDHAHQRLGVAKGVGVREELARCALDVAVALGVHLRGDRDVTAVVASVGALRTLHQTRVCLDDITLDPGTGRRVSLSETLIPGLLSLSTARKTTLSY